jgi:Na+-driven multidrug efflux pump
VAWGAAAATVIGQALGAEEPRRAWLAGHAAALQASLLGGCAALTYWWGAEGIFALMHRDAAVREVGIPALRFVSYFQVPLVLLIVYVSALRGAGDTRYPMLFTLAGIFLVRLPLAWLLGVVMQGGLIGAWIGMCADVSVRSLLATVRYTRGKWLKLRV